ncbi:MAG: hypothetical protein PHO48_01000 [Candidatus Gracilibacteria bacterium]|nr:hypothetical protein [Candidatus Gracilibacteria bacterium]MDD5179324.1 hypothetical protein [Candidatus Gracilibacteria bacterium]
MPGIGDMKIRISTPRQNFYQQRKQPAITDVIVGKYISSCCNPSLWLHQLSTCNSGGRKAYEAAAAVKHWSQPSSR